MLGRDPVIPSAESIMKSKLNELKKDWELLQSGRSDLYHSTLAKAEAAMENKLERLEEIKNKDSDMARLLHRGEIYQLDCELEQGLLEFKRNKERALVKRFLETIKEFTEANLYFTGMGYESPLANVPVANENAAMFEIDGNILSQNEIENDLLLRKTDEVVDIKCKNGVFLLHLGQLPPFIFVKCNKTEDQVVLTDKNGVDFIIPMDIISSFDSNLLCLGQPV